MTNEEQERKEALYGPAARGSEYQEGDIVKYLDPDPANRSQGEEPRLLTGKVLFARGPGEAVRGGKVHPASYFVLPAFGGFPVAIYASDIVELVSRRADKTQEKQEP